jgi:hypothetical protein
MARLSPEPSPRTKVQKKTRWASTRQRVDESF